MDRLQSMRVFSKVVEQGSFARAAKVMELSNAVVTRHVADLETHLGARLMNRTTRKLSLTETGQAYLERVNRILADVDDADAIATAHSKKPTGILRIYSQLGFGKQRLAELLPPYAIANPDVMLDVTLSDRTVDLVEEGYDIGIFTGLQKVDASMISRQLGVAEVLALMEQLPDGCRLVLNLYAVDGYTHGEIAELLGIQESTSKAQLSKARKQLTRLHQQPANYYRL